MKKMGWFEVVRGHSGSWAMSPVRMTSYSTLIETVRLSCTVFEIYSELFVESRRF